MIEADAIIYDFDIFCCVIDNYGDVGVCWRLAQHLIARQQRVRLWVDALNVLQAIVPEIDPLAVRQVVDAVEVQRWLAPFEVPSSLGDVVIEAFACRLPAEFEQAMAQRQPVPVWLNLEYFSAEPWIDGCHGLWSPHPHLPLSKLFFMPSIRRGAGGVLREEDLFTRRAAWYSQQSEAWWIAQGGKINSNDFVISLFAYDLAPYTEWLGHISQQAQVTCLLVSPGPATKAVVHWLAAQSSTTQLSERRYQCGVCDIRLLDCVPQAQFDARLWASQLNIVRGEDSLVRAIWAGVPFVWHIYPQDDGAHWSKLNAFLDNYCEDLSPHAADVWRAVWWAWNGRGDIALAWARGMRIWHEICLHAQRWSDGQQKQPDLVTELLVCVRGRWGG